MPMRVVRFLRRRRWQEIVISLLVILLALTMGNQFVLNAQRRDELAAQFCNAIPNAAAAGATAASDALIVAAVAKARENGASAEEIAKTRAVGVDLALDAAARARANARKNLPDCPKETP
ncbi:MAG: hypothetical protein H0W81_11965 [Chloroflexi bacterium]|nr:hypothetical protein [Chloroflexota bacterium]